MNKPLASTNSQIDAFLVAVAGLPPLPKIVNYEDDYDEVVRSIKTETCEDAISLHSSGSIHKLNLLQIEPRVRDLIRNYLLFAVQGFATNSVLTVFDGFRQAKPQDIEFVASMSPVNVQAAWPSLVVKYQNKTLTSLKWLLAFLCRLNFMSWTSDYATFVSKALTIPVTGNYAAVRSGDAFLTIEEESRLVRWFDDSARKVESLDLSAVEEACVLVSSYQFGMRPKQLGMIHMRDCKVRKSYEDQSIIVHLTFKMIKQRDSALSNLPLVRKVKREWAPLYARLVELKCDVSPAAFLFGFTSRVELSLALNGKLREILGNDSDRTSYDLRHSMAQRLVDGGASHEELAAALGHSQLATGLIYFRQSVNQVQIINKALGLSEIYTTVVRIAKNKFISEKELAQLKGEQQVAGVPFGIPIAGIGGCQTGQPACPYNPVTACYGCGKFTPVSDIELHTQVLKEFRGVVNMFREAGRGDSASPAFLQLQRTIAAVQDVLKDLGAAER
jgi:integrase